MSAVNPEIHDTRNASHVSEVGLKRSSEQAWKHFSRAQTAEEFCGSWLAIQCHIIGGVSDGVVILQRPGETVFSPVAFYPEAMRDRTHLAEVTERALKEARGIVKSAEQSADSGETRSRYQLAYPVRLDGELRGVIGIDLDWRPEPQLQSAMRDLQWGSAWLEVLLRRNADPQESAKLKLKLALDLVSSLVEHPGLKEGTAAFATELAAKLGFDRVSVGILKRGRIRLCAVSHSANFDKRTNVLRAVQGAMEEAADQQQTVVYPPQRDKLPVVAQAHAFLIGESQTGSAATFPLESGRQVVGALTLERPSGYRFDPASLEICEAVASVAGPIIDLKRANERNLLAHAGESAASAWRKLVGPGHPVLKLVVVAALSVAAFFAFATGDYRISAKATVEGEVQRAISAPFNGYVKEALLRAGDTVKAGQLIARLDDRDLRLERIKLLGQRGQYADQQREAMAKHDRAQAETVTAQLDQVNAQLQQADEQLSRVELIAPFEGVIVSGDLSQKLGSPVERGQTLFEVAPLKAFRVILQVDERDLADVQTGQKGELTVTSMPEDRFACTVTKITAVNVAEEGRNVFRVEARLDEGLGQLRPGMEGVGKIYVDRRNLLWIWTHALTDWARLWVWSWLP